MTVRKPKEVSWIQAAAIPENWLTAYQALFIEANLLKGQNALVHAGASGVGVAGIQLALYVAEAEKVFTTCGTDEKVKFLEKLGDSSRLHAFNYRTQSKCSKQHI
jgi:NADPH:quinone reductase-like Zn-dependent oxidoreductase